MRRNINTAVYAATLTLTLVIAALLVATNLLAWFSQSTGLDYMKVLVYSVLVVEGVYRLFPRLYTGIRNAERVRTYRHAIDVLRGTHGQKITEYPQVDFWVKLTREADKAGAKLPYRESSSPREISKYAEMERARTRSTYFSGWTPPQKQQEQEPHGD